MPATSSAKYALLAVLAGKTNRHGNPAKLHIYFCLYSLFCRARQRAISGRRKHNAAASRRPGGYAASGRKRERVKVHVLPAAYVEKNPVGSRS